VFNLNNQECKLDFSKKTAILVRAMRNMFGLSQNDLSACAKIARPTISRLEKLDTDGVRADTLEKTLDFFNMQGVEFSFDNNGVTIHLPMRTLAKACILIQENTLARGGVSEEKTPYEKFALEREHPYARRDNESISEYIERLDREI
jgi:transcriptional regulator with XRE-family HTH domain